MKNRIPSVLIAIALLTTGIISCSKGDNLPDNQIKDKKGILVSLNWGLTGDSLATTYADLDMYLYKGADSTRDSSWTAYSTFVRNFEHFNLRDTLPDGDYTLMVDFLEVQQRGTLSFSFTGVEDHK